MNCKPIKLILGIASQNNCLSKFSDINNQSESGTFSSRSVHYSASEGLISKVEENLSNINKYTWPNNTKSGNNYLVFRI